MPQELIGILETEFNTVEKTRCVLREASEYLEGTDRRQDLPRMASHIAQLLYVVDYLLVGMGNVLDKRINSYYGDIKKEKMPCVDNAQSMEVNEESAAELRQQIMEKAGDLSDEQLITLTAWITSMKEV